MGRLHSAVDWLYGFIFNDATLTGGKDTYIQGVSLVTSTTGVALGTAGNPIVVSTGGGSTPSLSTSRIPSSAATTNATNAKASAGTVYQIIATNTAAAIRYLKIYNKASAPTVGTDVPVLTIAIPAVGAVVLDYDYGYGFSAGISYALTTLAADADSTAVALGDIVGLNVLYS